MAEDSDSGDKGNPGSASTLRQAELELVRFKLGIERSADAVFMTDVDGRIVYVNPAFEKMYGFTPEEACGKTPRIIKSGVLQAEVYEGFWAALLNKEVVTGEILNRTKDGRLLTIEGSANPILGENGEIIGHLAIHRDVTERKRTEDLLLNVARGVSAATGESFFRSLVRHLAESMGADFCLVGEVLEGTVPAVRSIAIWKDGRAAENVSYLLAGSPCEQAIERGSVSYASGVRERFPADNLLVEMKIEGYVGTALRGSVGAPVGVMNLLFRKPIESLPIAESLLQIFAARAAAELARLRIEEALQTSEERFRRLSEAAFEGIAIIEGGRILDCNSRMAAMLGHTQEQMLGRNLIEFVAPESIQAVQEHMLSASEDPFDHFARRPDGSLFPVQTQAKLIRFEGRTLRVTAVRDISEQRRAEEERARLEERLRQAQKLETIGQLAGGIAHDFNNLLSPIIGYAELIQEDLPPGSTLSRGIGVIREAAQRAAELTRQLLSYSRKQVLDLRVLDLNQVVANFERLLRTTLRESIEIRIVLGRDVPAVRGDSSQIEQLLLNLAANAQDALPHGGTFAIETSACMFRPEDVPGNPREAALHARLRIRDSGTGIPPEALGHIFEPFYTTKEVGKGTGLGLATVYGIVKQHQGQITVESASGGGTTFDVYLPGAGESPTVASAPAAGSRAETGTGTVIVVEDNDLVRDLACSVLAQNGYRVLEFRSPRECLRAFENAPVSADLLLSDVVMPGLNGVELYGRLSGGMPKLKVLYMSGYADDVISSHGVLNEGISLIQKPFSIQALAEKVREILDQP